MTALTRDRIEAAALALVEKEGLGGLSMRRLGQALHVEAMSLYHHYPSKAHLLDALLDRVLAKIRWPDEALGWRPRIEGLAREWRRVLRAHPKLAQLMLVHRMNTRFALGQLERVAAPFLALESDPAQAAPLFRAFSYYLMGALHDETAGYAQGPSAADPVPLAEQRQIAPGVLSMGPYFGQAHWDLTFELGMKILLDGFERRAPKVRS